MSQSAPFWKSALCDVTEGTDTSLVSNNTPIGYLFCPHKAAVWLPDHRYYYYVDFYLTMEKVRSKLCFFKSKLSISERGLNMPLPVDLWRYNQACWSAPLECEMGNKDVNTV